MGDVGCHGVAMVVRLLSRSLSMISPYVAHRWVMMVNVVTLAKPC